MSMKNCRFIDKLKMTVSDLTVNTAKPKKKRNKSFK